MAVVMSKRILLRCSALVLAAGASTAVASPSAMHGRPTLAYASAKACNRYHSADDSDARVLARTAETAAETYATDHNGEYKGISPAKLHAIEWTLTLTPRQARHEHELAYLLSASGTTSSYILRTRAFNGDTYSLARESSGEVTRRGRVCGKLRSW
jgi:hypothetical protein